MVGAIFVHLFILHDGSAWVFSGFPLLILVVIAWKPTSSFPGPVIETGTLQTSAVPEFSSDGTQPTLLEMGV
jgi:hypothetical protein